jgi:DNA-binding MarR family transcriptional regulator
MRVEEHEPATLHGRCRHCRRNRRLYWRRLCRACRETAAHLYRPRQTTKAAVLRCLRECGPLTAREIADRTGRKLESVERRLTELAAGELLEKVTRPAVWAFSGKLA